MPTPAASSWPLAEELRFRSSTGLGTGLRNARKLNGPLPKALQNPAETALAVVYLKGPASLHHTVSVPGFTVLRTEVSDLRERVGAKEKGVRIEVRLAGKRWPDRLSAIYGPFSAVAKREPSESAYYVVAPTSLTLGPRREKPPKVTVTPEGESLRGKRLVAVERGAEIPSRWFWIGEQEPR